MYDTNQILKLAINYEESCLQGLVKIARKKKSPGDRYRVENIKDVDNSDVDDKNVIDLMGAIDFSYSAIMREMRQKADKDQVRLLLTLFKKEFDNAVKNNLQKPEKVALQNSLIKFNKKHKIKVNKKLVKNAAVTELGNPVQVGKYLADIVRFTLNKVPLELRAKAIESLRKKFYSFNANEIAMKDLPATAAVGTAIAFVKQVLNGQDSFFIRNVINSMVGYL